MNKTTLRRLFKAIEDGDEETINGILDAEPEGLEAFGQHNRFVRDKTPLMYAMQCRNLRLANLLLDRGADAAAVMPGGPGSSVLSLCMMYANSDLESFDDWVRLATRLLDEGADSNTGLWPALYWFGKIIDRPDLIRLMLDHGADPDQRAGNCGDTVRELVAINRRLYPASVLTLFGVSDA